MTKIIRLSDENRKILLDIANSIGLSERELQDDRLENRDPKFAMNYLRKFLNSESDEKILFVYMVVVMLLIKNG